MRWILLVACLFAAAYWLWPAREDTPANSAGEQATSTERPPMVAQGYIPAGAPLKPPPLPDPRPGFVRIDFARLGAFDYDPEVDLVPEDIEALDGQQVELAGVMYYAVADPQRVTSFYLMPNHMLCAYGEPRANDVVDIQLAAGRHTIYALEYFIVRGTLRVGAMRDEGGTVLTLFRLENARAEIIH